MIDFTKAGDNLSCSCDFYFHLANEDCYLQCPNSIYEIILCELFSINLYFIKDFNKLNLQSNAKNVIVLLMLIVLSVK